MKYTLVLLLVLMLFSCTTTKRIIDSNTQKEVRLFKTRDYSFYIPRQWEEMKKYKFPNTRSHVFAPKNCIDKVLSTDTYFEASPVLFRISKRRYKAKTSKDLYDYLNNQSPRITTTGRVIQNEIEIKRELLKVSDTHVIETMNWGDVSTEDRRDIPSENVIIHYILVKNKLYRLTFFSPASDQMKYIDGYDYILQTFRFKNQDIDLKLSQKP